MKHKTMKEIIAEFKEITPGIEVKEQPKTALKQLIELEESYGINTRDILLSNKKIDKKIRTKWLEIYYTFYIHKGDLSKLNTIE